MKNKILWTALAAMSLAACSNDDVVSVPQNDNASDAIKFRTSVTNSRANTDVTGSNLSSFWVGALKDDGDNNNEAIWGTNAFKYYKKNGTTGVFEPTNYLTGAAATDATWPAYSLKFFATNLNLAVTNGANKYTINPPTTTDDTDTPTVNYTITGNVADQEDIVYATNKGARSDFSATGSIPLNFRHALCEIIIKAQNSMADEYVIKVRGYKIYMAGFCVGTFTLPQPITITDPNDTNSPIAKWSFTDADKKKTSTIISPFRGGYTVTENATSDASGNYQNLTSTAVTITGNNVGSNFEGYAKAIPINSEGTAEADLGYFTGYHLGTSGTNDGTYIALLVQIDDVNGNAVFPKTTASGKRIAYRGLPKYYGYVAAPVTIKWEAGKVYTYTLNFQDGLGINDPHQPEVVDPDNYDPKDDNGTDELDEEEKGKENDPLGPGENVLGKAIAFDVTVGTWTSTTNTNVTM
jgi:hypothetical protein